MTAADLPHTAVWKHAVHFRRPRLRRWELAASELPGARVRRDRAGLVDIFEIWWGYVQRYDRGVSMPIRTVG